MSEFTASNGIKVRIDSPYLDLHTGQGWGAVGGSKETEAIREFFQHERDEELGRWRWPENSEYVVYAKKATDPATAMPSVRVISESTGRSRDLERSVLNACESTLSAFGKAARAYFEAHPERKPWHDAKTGEVWVITVVGEESAWTVNNKGQFENPDSTYELTNPHITAARRIWPVSND